jgi:gamma-glutamyl-gamma-aminobutyrate hydrolase PuuD
VASSGSDDRPVVGITAYGELTTYGVWHDSASVVLPETYPNMVVAGGGIPVLLPPIPGVVAAVERLDALVIAGGPDVAPSRYGALPDPRTGAPRHDRDELELAALARALELGIPVLAVCRGHQILNVACGGTLVQHMDGHTAAPGRFTTTAIALEPGSLVAKLLGDAVDGQCHHHQAIDELGSGLTVTARAADGTIEAVELADHPFVVGVQWHPEQDDPRLFTALTSAALERIHQ